MANVIPTATFQQEVIAQSGYLVEQAPAEWLENFVAAIDQLRRALTSMPAMGKPEKQNARIALRSLMLSSKLPYIVYYAHRLEDPITEVRLLRLVHERQRRPRMTVPFW